MQSAPVEFEWNGELVPLSGLEATLMAAVMVRGRATWEELESMLPLAGSTLKVIVHRVRGKFRKLGAADPLESVREWGLRLRVEPDATGSAAVWIGADEGTEPPTGGRGDAVLGLRIDRPAMDAAGMLPSPGRRRQA